MLRWLPALVAALVLAAMAAGCGGSDEAGGADGGGAKAADRSDEAEIRAVLSDMGAAMEARDLDQVCRLMTSDARRRMAEIGRGFQGDGQGAQPATCALAFEAMLDGELIEDLTPEITSVEVRGPSAVVVARSSHDSDPGTARLRKEGGAWRVAMWFSN